jgi:hypothetical protein
MAACSTLSMLYPVPAPTKLNMGTKLQREHPLELEALKREG